MREIRGSARKTSAVIILIMVLFAGFFAITTYYSEKVNTERLLNSSASALDYQTDRSLRAIDDLLSDAAERIALDKWPDESLVLWLQGRLSAFPEISNIALIKPDGRIVPPILSSDGQNIRQGSVAEQEYVRYHITHPRDRDMHIGNPVTADIDGVPGIPVSKAIFDRSGTLIAIVRALINPAYLTQAMGTVQTLDHSFNALIRSDGLIIARAPDQNAYVGRSVASGKLFSSVLRHQPNGVGRFRSPFGNSDNVLAYRTSRHFNLVVIAGVPTWQSFESWRTEIYGLLLLLIGLSTALYLVAALSDSRDRQRQQFSLAAQEAEREAAKAQQQFRDAIETISDGFALYDKNDRLVLCNAQYRTMFTGAEDVIQPGNSFADIVRTVGDRGLYNYQGHALESFLSYRIEEHQNPSGHALMHPIKGGRWIVSKEFRTHDGGVVATRTDVTELRRREEEVEALKKRYELILDSAGDGIIGISAEETIIFANRAADQMLGVDNGTLIGINFRKALYGNPQNSELPAFPLDGENSIAGESQFSGIGDRAFIAEYVLAPIRDEDEFDGAVLVFRNISLRKLYEAGLGEHQKALEQEVIERTKKLSTEIEQRSRTEEALRKSQSRLQNITSNLFEGVLLVDTNGHILFANPSAQRLLGDEQKHLAGTDLDETMRVEEHDTPVDFLESPLYRAIEAGEPVIEDDAVFVTHDQRRLSVGYAVAPLIEDGKRRGAVISFRSIEVLKSAQREAVQASRLAIVGQLAAGIAHEINTPIQYVGDNLRFTSQSIDTLGKAMAEMKAMLEQGSHAAEMAAIYQEQDIDYLLEELPQALSQSLEGVNHVAHIVRSMKEFSHPGTTAKVATDINRAIDSTITVSRNEWKHVATVETDLAADMPMVECFPAEINQVLLNLIVNAAHAIESQKRKQTGVIRVATRSGTDCIEIRISDDGPGVPKAIRDKIFDPFFTTKGVGKGTGQGLAICLDVIANKHGGKIFLDETTETGATFVIKLPAKDAGKPAQDPNETDAPA